MDSNRRRQFALGDPGVPFRAVASGTVLPIGGAARILAPEAAPGKSATNPVENSGGLFYVVQAGLQRNHFPGRRAMRSMKYVMLACAMLLTVVMMAYAQEKGCEYEGKKYEHHDQVFNLKGDNKCWICDDGEWIQGFRHIETYCKGKY